jgi:hypothetical protein
VTEEPFAYALVDRATGRDVHLYRTLGAARGARTNMAYSSEVLRRPSRVALGKERFRLIALNEGRIVE